MKKKLLRHNLFGEDTYKSDAGNISGIIDKMLRVTTKVTSCYAGDIVYSIQALADHIEKFPDLDFRKLLGFREMGVTAFDVVSAGENDMYVVLPPGAQTTRSEFIQSWVLNYTPTENTAFGAKGTVIFERVDIMS